MKQNAWLCMHAGLYNTCMQTYIHTCTYTIEGEREGDLYAKLYIFTFSNIVSDNRLQNLSKEKRRKSEGVVRIISKLKLDRESTYSYLLRILVPTKKHGDADSHDIELPFLLSQHSLPLRKSPTHPSHQFDFSVALYKQRN